MRRATVDVDGNRKAHGSELLEALGNALHAQEIVVRNRIRMQREVRRGNERRPKPLERLSGFLRAQSVPERFHATVLRTGGQDHASGLTESAAFAPKATNPVP
jgi:hypothetical protein